MIATLNDRSSALVTVGVLRRQPGPHHRLRFQREPQRESSAMDCICPYQEIHHRSLSNLNQTLFSHSKKSIALWVLVITNSHRHLQKQEMYPATSLISPDVGEMRHCPPSHSNYSRSLAKVRAVLNFPYHSIQVFESMEILCYQSPTSS
jgi:hypothetical protein